MAHKGINNNNGYNNDDDGQKSHSIVMVELMKKMRHVRTEFCS